MQIAAVEVNQPAKMAYSVAEASALTSLSKSFIRNLIRDKKLKAKTANRRVLILPGDLRAYLEGQEDWKPTNSNGGNN
jgi:excisionase family DNA binding protein